MKTNFLVLNRILPVGFNIENKFYKLAQTFKNDAVEISTPVKELSSRNFFTELLGIYSKENVKQIDSLANEYKTTNIDIEEKRDKLFEELDKIKQKFPKSESDENILIINQESINQELKSKAKEILIQLMALTKVKFERNPNISITPLNQIQNPLMATSRFIHPRDKAETITGVLISEDLESIKEKEELNKNLSNESLICKKLKTLKILQRFLAKANVDFIGTLSDKEIAQIKNLIISYDALNNILQKRGIYTHEAEQNLFASKIPQNVKKGDVLNGLGVVINRIMHKGTSAIIMLSNYKGFNCFKMYDLEKLTKAETKEEEAKSVMAEISTKYTGKETTIQSFYNHNPKEYPNAGMVLGLQAMKIITKNNNNSPINIEALAYAGNKRSPVNYYMHFGFSPVNYTKEEIEQISKENCGRFPYETLVELTMNDFEQARKRIELMEKVYLKEVPDRSANIFSVIDSVKSYIRNLFINLFSC